MNERGDLDEITYATNNLYFDAAVFAQHRCRTQVLRAVTWKMLHF